VLAVAAVLEEAVLEFVLVPELDVLPELELEVLEVCPELLVDGHVHVPEAQHKVRAHKTGRHSLAHDFWMVCVQTLSKVAPQKAWI